MDYTSIFTLMRAEVTLTAILVFVFLYDLMAGERARRRFSAVVCCLMVVQVDVYKRQIQSSVCHCSVIGANTFTSTVSSTNAAAPFETTER